MEPRDWVAALLGLFACGIAIGSALFTYGQVKVLRAQSQVDAHSRIAGVTRELMSLAFSYPELLGIFEDKPLADRRKQERYLQLWLNHIEVIWNIQKEGLLKGAAWHASRKDIQDFFTLRIVRDYWHGVREYYPGDFVQFIWSILPRETDAEIVIDDPKVGKEPVRTSWAGPIFAVGYFMLLISAILRRGIGRE